MRHPVIDGSDARSRSAGNDESRQDDHDWQKVLHTVEHYATCRSHMGSHSGPAFSQTHASLANHSCTTRQSGQWVRLKNTGLERKVVGSTYLPVEIACPVVGQRIIIMPMRNPPPTIAALRTVRVRRRNKSPVTIPRLYEGRQCCHSVETLWNNFAASLHFRMNVSLRPEGCR